ncbi:DUF6233 domain-containing protein [Streptomyces cyaneofuscatus]|uniref:DUF6233 domain-containing protein n=1 Tax=Streptomyces cyaneofuscatus TaxID=66883 RepID=UPI0034500721
MELLVPLPPGHRLRRPRQGLGVLLELGLGLVKGELGVAQILGEVVHGRTAETALLHRGGCGLYKSGALIDREAAISALSEPDIAPCEVCAPETGLRQE